MFGLNSEPVMVATVRHQPMVTKFPELLGLKTILADETMDVAVA